MRKTGQAVAGFEDGRGCGRRLDTRKCKTSDAPLGPLEKNTVLPTPGF